jgi:glucose-1-phosphate thymidylyltransferase
MVTKSLILASGAGSRLGGWNKGMLPVYNKLAIYYALDLAAEVGMKSVGITCGYSTFDIFWSELEETYRDMEIHLIIQKDGEGPVAAIQYAESWLNKEGCLVQYVDNINLDPVLPLYIKDRLSDQGCTTFPYFKQNNTDCGQIVIDAGGVASLVEKADPPVSPWCLGGVHIFDKHISNYAKMVKPRPELNMVDLCQIYNSKGQLHIGETVKEVYDIGTFEGLYAASTAVRKLNGYN